jgi:hypothetical protein
MILTLNGMHHIDNSQLDNKTDQEIVVMLEEAGN